MIQGLLIGARTNSTYNTHAKQNPKTEKGREYFTIGEGAHRGKTASVSLDKGKSRFSIKDERVGPVKLRYDKLIRARKPGGVNVGVIEVR